MIKQLTLHNWQCYRGTHVLRFRAGAYAIVAQHESEPGWSNFSGKSALLEAIDFALFGRLNKIRNFDANGWITNGEKQGVVSLVLEDGTAIKRERVRGQSTQVRLSTADGRTASQDDASVAMLKHLCFNAEDFKTVGFFESKQMSRIIRADPKDRLEAVRGWLNLLPAERAEKLAGELAKGRIRELQKLRGRREAVVAMLERSPIPDDTSKLIEQREQAQNKLDELQKQWQAHRDVRGYQKTVKEYKELVALGKKTAEEVTNFPDNLEQEVERLEQVVSEKTSLHREASKKVGEKKQVALGLFDGQCPVAPIECPVKKKINSDRETSQSALEIARRTERLRFEEMSAARKTYEEVREYFYQAKGVRNQLESLRERALNTADEYKQAKKALKKLGDLPDEETIRSEMQRWQTQRDVAVLRLGEIKQENAQRERLQQELSRLEKDIEMEAERAAVLIQTRSIFRATQRRLAERMLNHIGNRANQTLSEAGVDLSIGIRWEKEGKDLAKNCEMCGAAFPSSAKIKVCEQCGAERGQNIIQRLDFVLSDRSDGADDFAGIAMQLAAGSWLLSSKQSPWGTCLVDEPFAALDTFHRKQAAKQLLQLVELSVYRQVFVISHSQDTVAMYPHMIKIVVDRDGQRRIEVD